MMGDKYRRALLAFPDEDVLVGTRLLGPDGFKAFAGLTDVVPAPSQKATGEERAWGRRLAKRFGADGRIDDRTFVVTGDGGEAGGFDFASHKSEPDRRRRHLLRVGRLRRTAGGWSPSGGPWPRTWPPASSAADPASRPHPHRRVAVHSGPWCPSRLAPCTGTTIPPRGAGNSMGL